MSSWKLLSLSDRGFPRAHSSPPKKVTMSRQWKEKRPGNGSRSLDTLTGPDGVCVTKYRYTGLSRAAAHRGELLLKGSCERRLVLFEIFLMIHIS